MDLIGGRSLKIGFFNDAPWVRTALPFTLNFFGYAALVLSPFSSLFLIALGGGKHPPSKQTIEPMKRDLVFIFMLILDVLLSHLR